jgi:WD40 repeat protein
VGHSHWKTQTQHNLTNHLVVINSVAFSPDGTRVVSGGSDGTVRVSDAGTGRVLSEFGGHKEKYDYINIKSVAFSSDGKRILSVDNSGDVKYAVMLSDATTGRLLRVIDVQVPQDPSHPGRHSATFSPDGKFILTTDSNGSSYKISNWETGQPVQFSKLDFECFEPSSVKFAPDEAGVLLLCDRRPTLVDERTGRKLREFSGPSSDVISSVAISHDGTHLFSEGWSNKVWDLSAARLSGTFVGRLFPPDATRVLVKAARTTLNDLVTGKERQLVGTNELFQALSPDGTRALVTDGRTHTARLFDVTTGSVLHTLHLTWELKGAPIYDVKVATFSPDSTRALTAHYGMELWDAVTGVKIHAFDDSSYISTAAFSPDGIYVISGDFGGDLKLWDTTTGKLVRKISADEHGYIQSVIFSPDGTRVLSGHSDGNVKLWDAATGMLMRSFVGHFDRITSLAFSSDGKRVISVSSDGTIKVWNPLSGELLATLIASGDGDVGDWLIMTPSGFFTGSMMKIDRLVNVVRGLRPYSVAQMYQALYDPDLVREELAGDPDREVKKAAEVLDLAKVLDSGQAPEVMLLSPVKDNSSENEVISAEARITNSGGGIGRIEWRVNGTTVAISGSAPGSGNTRMVKQTLALEPGKNTIEVIAYNDRNLLASLPVSATVTWNAPANQPRPKLFVITVGINDYRDQHFPPLSHAVDDAKAFGAAMKAAGQGLYADVDVTYVLDSDATAAGLEKAIDEVGTKMHPRDVFVFLAAAHGKSENGRFHLIPQDYRNASGRPWTEGTIGQDQLQDWFANRIKARRGLILLDTCESGALVASRASGVDLGNSEAAMGRLNEATGRPVLTAAAANQAALEGYRGHGVFTYALLDALVNGDTNNDGQIELSELVAHIQTLAPQLSRRLSPGRGSVTAPSLPRAVAAQLRAGPIVASFVDRGLTRVFDERGLGRDVGGYRQKPKLGSRGEDFPLVNRLSALPAAAQ